MRSQRILAVSHACLTGFIMTSSRMGQEGQREEKSLTRPTRLELIWPLLVCPACHGALDHGTSGIRCRQCTREDGKTFLSIQLADTHSSVTH